MDKVRARALPGPLTLSFMCSFPSVGGLHVYAMHTIGMRLFCCLYACRAMKNGSKKKDNNHHAVHSHPLVFVFFAIGRRIASVGVLSALAHCAVCVCMLSLRKLENHHGTFIVLNASDNIEMGESIN